MCRRLKRPDRSDCLCNNGLACVCCCVLLCPCLLLYVFVDVVGTCDQRDRQRQQCPERNSKVHNVPNDGLTIPTSKNDFRSPPQTNTRRGTIGFDVMCVCVCHVLGASLTNRFTVALKAQCWSDVQSDPEISHLTCQASVWA